MAIKTKDELIKQVSDALGDNITSDVGIALLEDIKDTFENSTGGSSDEDKKKIEELEQKVKDTDSMWRKKYTDAFLNPSPDPKTPSEPQDDPQDDDEEDDEPKTFDDLFSSENK